jgi:hypothetical protein
MYASSITVAGRLHITCWDRGGKKKLFGRVQQNAKGIAAVNFRRSMAAALSLFSNFVFSLVSIQYFSQSGGICQHTTKATILSVLSNAN